MERAEPYVHEIRGADNLIGPPFEILSDKAVKHYEKMKDKGENVYIDTLTYDEFMMLGDTELSRRFSLQDEAEQKAKIDREQANELEYVDESQKADNAANASATSGNAGGKPVRNPEREKPKWEDTITNRMLHWSYTPEQKEELKMALAAGVPKATILTYFYPEVTVEKMSSYRQKAIKKRSHRYRSCVILCLCEIKETYKSEFTELQRKDTYYGRKINSICYLGNNRRIIYCNGHL